MLFHIKVIISDGKGKYGNRTMPCGRAHCGTDQQHMHNTPMASVVPVHSFTNKLLLNHQQSKYVTLVKEP
jgi:hypothetical protein